MEHPRRGQLWRRHGIKHETISHKNKYDYRSRLFLIILRRLFVARAEMSIKRAIGTLNAAS